GHMTVQATTSPPPEIVGISARAALVAAIIVVAAAALPLVLSNYQVGLATEVLIFGILAMSIDILAGFAGRTSLGHGAIFGVSTYVVIYSTAQAGLPPAAGFAAGGLAATLVAASFGLLAGAISGVCL